MSTERRSTAPDAPSDSSGRAILPSLDVTETDLYVASGVFCVLVYVAGVAALVETTSVELWSSHFALFSLGFWQFVACYYLFLWLYHRLER